MFDLFNTPDAMPDLIHVRVTPNAKKEMVKLTHNPDQSVLYRVYVNAPPEDGKANKAVVELLAKEIGIAKSKLKIIKGHTTKDKVIQINEV